MNEPMEITENKKQMFFREMEKKDRSACRAWERLRVSEGSWEKKKDQLVKLGLWREYCDAKGWDHSASFMDLGA